MSLAHSNKVTTLNLLSVKCDEYVCSQDAPRPSRSRERHDDTEKPLPKLKEQEKPNFVASNKFSFLTEDGEDAPLE